MQVTTEQPLWRQSHSQPDALVLLWQPAVPKEHLACLQRLAHIASFRVTIPYTLPRQPSLLETFAGGRGRPQFCVCIHFTIPWGFLPLKLTVDKLPGVLCNCVTALHRQQEPGVAVCLNHGIMQIECMHEACDGMLGTSCRSPHSPSGGTPSQTPSSYSGSPLSPKSFAGNSPSSGASPTSPPPG